MKVLFIGGTGNISTSCSKQALAAGIDLYHLNRGIRGASVPGVKNLLADISDLKQCHQVLNDHRWDVVVNWIAFTPEEVQRDFELFAGKTKQYIFISSASAYQKPPSHPVITESTPLKNPYWDYSRNKIACELLLEKFYREHDFPITIVRPSLTYDTVLPVIGSWTDYTVARRMEEGRKIIIHGDGTSLWTITHADDFARGFTGLLGHQQATGHAFHITSDEILSWNQIYEALAEALGAELKAVHIPSDFICRKAESLGMDMWGTLLGDKSHSVIFDNSKIKRFVPAYKAVIPFKEGIKRTIAWYREEQSRMVILEENNRMLDFVIAAYEKAFVSIQSKQ
jgi:nucleoside-diphosphate-sugar epimerase